MDRNKILTVFAATVAFIFLAGLSCLNINEAAPPDFDSNRAFEYLEHQVAFGPRVPGAKAHENAYKWLVSVLRQHTPHVTTQQFKGTFGDGEVEMKNILASFYPDKKERILLCAHWDSRHHADKDPDPVKWTQPVPGANDGASGVAVLLEIASGLMEKEPPAGVDIVFFDGEDSGAYGENDTWLLGSRHFARVMPFTYRPKYAILLDMIGDRDLSLSRDINSIDSAPRLWERIIRHCENLDIALSPGTFMILDDHVPLIQRGIPSVDLIDFDFTFWHTVSDTPDKCSAESLGKIGALVLRLIYEE